MGRVRLNASGKLSNVTATCSFKTLPKPVGFRLGDAREDVVELLVPAIEGAATAEIMGVASLACGLVTMGTSDASVSSAILSKLVDMRETDAIKTCHARMAVLGNVSFDKNIVYHRNLQKKDTNCLINRNPLICV